MPTTFPTLNDDTGELEDLTYYFPDEVAEMLRIARRTVVTRLTSARWPGLFIGHRWYMSAADVAAAVEVERSRRARPMAEPGPRPRLGLAIDPDEADRLEGLR